MGVSAVFLVEPPSWSGPVVGHGDSSGPKLPATTNTASGGTLTVGPITSTNAFANQVDFLNPMSINWSYSLDSGANWCDAGISTNLVYVTWTNSLNTIHTLLDVGCRAAQGAIGIVGANDDRVLDAVWAEIQTLSIRRASDNVMLTYYGFYDVNTNGAWDPGTDVNRNTPDLCIVTDAANLISAGNGQCRSWADFMLQALRAQGLATVNGGPVALQAVVIKSPYVAFAVQNWATTGSSPRTVISLDAGVDGATPAVPNPSSDEAADSLGAAGQGNSPNPPSNFYNHWIVRRGQTYYDPSYALGPFTDRKVYEEAAFAGRHQIGRAHV